MCWTHTLLWGFALAVCLSWWVRLVESRPCVKSLPDYSLSLMAAGSSGSIRLTDALKHRAQQPSPQSPFKQRFLPNCWTWWLHKWTEVSRHIHHGNLQTELVEMAHIRTVLSWIAFICLNPGYCAPVLSCGAVSYHKKSVNSSFSSVELSAPRPVKTLQAFQVFTWTLPQHTLPSEKCLIGAKCILQHDNNQKLKNKDSCKRWCEPKMNHQNEAPKLLCWSPVWNACVFWPIHPPQPIPDAGFLILEHPLCPCDNYSGFLIIIHCWS